MMLSNKNNMYACAELGSLEFDGLISGEKNYDKSYEYYMRAALKNHPKACWMVANLMLSGKVKMNFDIMWKYLYKSIELGSAAGYNTLGLLYKKGINKENKVDLEKAKEYFLISSEMGYVYAFNNLGKLYEDEGNVEEAIKYYKISADMMESWALNKVGEYYRKKGDYKTAFIYYSKSIEAPINEKNNYAYYNLAKYYYENGNICANIKVDSKKAECYYKLSGIKK
jgi:TPR repeat protein